MRGGTAGARKPWRRMGVYPRVRGGTTPIAGQSHGARSIPACAGNLQLPEIKRVCPRVYPRAREPCPVRFHQQKQRVYPRARGNPATAAEALAAGRLSPRARGNHPSGRWLGRAGRPVYPACAGNRRGRCSRRRHEVYPRCARGNPIGTPVDGEGKVYPRVRGGTRSPSVPHREWRNRSIPACAGEPSLIQNWVKHNKGLSRVRGNLHQGAGQRQRRGSIPVCAGNRNRCSGETFIFRSIPVARGNPKAD